jgi:hypothetical protein
VHGKLSDPTSDNPIIKTYQEKVGTDQVHFKPSFEISAGYNIPIDAGKRKIKKQIEERKTREELEEQREKIRNTKVQNKDGEMFVRDIDLKNKILNPENKRYKFQDGGEKEMSPGFIELELTDDEIEQYVKGGYIVEEFQEGGNTNTLEGDLIAKILMERNRDKEFVQRAFNPENYPDHIQYNEDGTTSTHRMAWGTDDAGQAYMFPTIFNEANEAIKVPNQYADYISSQGYKKATGMNKKQKGGPVRYNIGDEVDEATMKELEKLGYTFEEI